VVPSETLHDSAGGAPWVMKVAGRRLLRQPVTLGVRGAGHTEIVAGLLPGELVAAGTAGLDEGERVRPVAAAAAPGSAPARPVALPMPGRVPGG
jgi:HlyD family secretion protein